MKRSIKNRNLRALVVLALALGAAPTALAQGFPGEGPAVGPHPGHPPLDPEEPDPGVHHRVRREMMKHLYPVGLIRHHSEELQLGEAQFDKLRALVAQVKGELEQLKWNVDLESQKLVGLLAKNASQAEIFAQLDRVFEVENQIKKKQLGLLIAVREILTQKQRQRLDQIKAELGFDQDLPRPPGRGGFKAGKGRGAR